VAEATLGRLSALDGIAAPGRYGRTDTAPGVIVSELPAPGLATVTARKGRGADAIASAQAAFGIALPTTPRRVEGGDLAFVWSGPEQWLAHCAQEPPGGMEALLAGALGATAAIVDQSHARLLLRISGPRVRDALAKGVAIDLDPSAFKTADTAITSVARITVQLWQSDDAPTYVLSIARSLAGSFWDWLETCSAEYGVDLRANADPG
jgi:methylglutamate dehydrogenase subunit D